jgi:hypothetical protein
VTFSISHPGSGVRLGVDECPGVGERGHGLTMAVIHGAGCCQEWATGRASSSARVGSFRQAAARWGAAWPGQRQHPDAGAGFRQAVAGTEPEAGQ